MFITKSPKSKRIHSLEFCPSTPLIDILLLFRSSNNLSFMADMWRDEVPDVMTMKSVKLFDFDLERSFAEQSHKEVEGQTYVHEIAGVVPPAPLS